MAPPSNKPNTASLDPTALTAHSLDILKDLMASIASFTSSFEDAVAAAGAPSDCEV